MLRSKPPERIVIVRLSHLGDVVHALPVFHALRRAHPRAELAWVVQPEFADLLADMPGLARVFLFERRGGWRAWLRLRRALAQFGADLAVDAQGNVKSAVATWCSGAPRRAGLDRADWREPIAARVLNDPAPPTPPERRHAVERMLTLARHVGNGQADAPPRMDPALTEAELARGEQACRRWLPHDPRGAVVLALARPGDVRSWPLEHFRDLARELLRRGRGVTLLSGPAEEVPGRALAQELGSHPRLAHWVEQKGLRELAAFFAVAARRGARLVACDSGPAHLAAACGLPVVSLAGPQDPGRTGPWPADGDAPHRVVQARDAPPCAPCLARRCRLPEGPVCMSGLAPADVARALLSEEP